MKQKINKIFNILSYCFIFIAAIFTITTINLKENTKDGITIFNHQMMVVETESMEKNELVNVDEYEIKSIKKNSLIIVKVVDENDPYSFYKEIEINDVLTFKYMIGNKQETITHRVINKTPKEDGFIFELRGDNINKDGTTSTQIIDTTEEDSFNYIVGKVIGTSHPMGVVITSMKSDVGIIGVIIIPSIILIFFEIMKISNEVNKEKIQKSKNKDIELQNKNQELEELKRRLLELESEKKEGKLNETH